MKLTCDYCGASFEIKEHPICPICGASYEDDEQYKRHLVRAAREQEIRLRKEEQEARFQEAVTERMNRAIAQEDTCKAEQKATVQGHTPVIKISDKGLKKGVKVIIVLLILMFVLPLIECLLAVAGFFLTLFLGDNSAVSDTYSQPTDVPFQSSGYEQDYVSYEPTAIPIKADIVTGGYLKGVSDNIVGAVMKSACISSPYYKSEGNRLKQSNKAIYCFEFEVENLQQEIYRFNAHDVSISADGYVLDNFILNEYHGHSTPFTVSLHKGDKKQAWICVEAPINTRCFRVNLTENITFEFDNFISEEEVVKFYEEVTYE